MSPRASERGVTLLELALALALTTLLAGMATPLLQGVLSNARERQAVEELLETLESARSVARSRLAEVDVDIQDRAVSVYLEGQLIDALELSSGIESLSLDDDDGTLRFNAAGGVDEVTPPTVTVRCASGEVRRIIVYPAIGSLRLEDL